MQKSTHLAKASGWALLAGLLSVIGCAGEVDNQGTMNTQSGETVEIHRDRYRDPLLGSMFYTSDPYYYENGSKGFVNKGDGLHAPDRETRWSGDR